MMNKKNFWIYLLSACVYFGQGIEDLPGSAFFFYLKETLHYDESKIMFLGSLIGLAWLIKPLIGYFIDTLGLSKRAWMLGSLGVTALLTAYLGLQPYVTIPVLVFLMMLGNWNAAVRDVAVDGIMCIEGKAKNITGRIQSVQWIAVTVASILVGVGGGYIAEHFNYQMGFLCLLPIYALMIWITSQYEETQATAKSRDSLIETLKKLFLDKNLLIVALFLFLYKFAPSFGTPLSFIMRDEFQWSKLWMGTLGTIGSVMSIIGAMLYFKFSKQLNLKKALTISVYIGAVTTLCYLYFTPVTCVIYDVVFSIIGMFIQLMLLDFMARNTKPGMEATSFALLCSVSNLAGTCDNIVGGLLFPLVGLTGLILISTATSFLCLPLIKRLKYDN